ncbi:MAG: dihydrodipicolinate synthase family protein [Clostridia bacterium]|nr:dihydrodipicolinate synthase family protein [Clostridia bacterium]
MKRYPAVIMATAVVPWDADCNFERIPFTKQVEHLCNHGVRNIYLFGTAGEGYAVNNRQFKEITHCFADLAKTLGFTPMVGLIDLSVPRMVEKLEIAYSMGVREYQFSLPSWGPLNDHEVDSFFKSLLGSYPDCTFLNYDLGRTKRFLEPRELFRLAEKHSNFAAVKYTRGLPEDFNEIASSGTPLQFFVTEQNFMELSRLTECGLLMSVGNADLKRAVRFVKLCHEGCHGEAQVHLDIFMQIRDKLKEAVDFQAIDSAYDKLFTKLAVEEFPLRLLPPYQFASDEKFNTFRQAVNSILG